MIGCRRVELLRGTLRRQEFYGRTKVIRSVEINEGEHSRRAIRQTLLDIAHCPVLLALLCCKSEGGVARQRYTLNFGACLRGAFERTPKAALPYLLEGVLP